MADVTGPISTLPGSLHGFPAGTPCDTHPDRQAVARIQGETDSFGAEMNDMCAECLQEHLDGLKSADARSGSCDWCHGPASDLRSMRDYEEGMAGPVYRVCGACARRQEAQLAEELADQSEDWG